MVPITAAIGFCHKESDVREREPIRRKMEDSVWDRSCLREWELGSIALLGQRDFEAYHRDGLELADASFSASSLDASVSSLSSSQRPTT